MAHTILIFAYRKPGTTPEQFRAHYEAKHIPLVKEIRGEHFPLSHTRRYIHRSEGGTERNAEYSATVVLDAQADFDYDMIAQLRFTDLAHFQTLFSITQEPENAARRAADEDQFLDRAEM